MKAAPLGRACQACVLTALVALAAAPAAFARFGDTTLRTGDQNHDVKVLQSWLTHLGFTTTIDGDFGPGTARSERAFERKYNLPVDGVADTSDEAALRKAMQQQNSSDPTDPNQGSTTPVSTTPGEKATLSSDGRTAEAPADAPQQVQEVIAAANEITSTPYRYGGGHGRGFNDTAFDCSGAVSHALHGAGWLRQPLDSSQFETWGSRGRGQWITVYANSGHAYLVVAGLRFDTSGSGQQGPRWRPQFRSSSGYVARHPAGF